MTELMVFLDNITDWTPPPHVLFFFLFLIQTPQSLGNWVITLTKEYFFFTSALKASVLIYCD